MEARNDSLVGIVEALEDIEVAFETLNERIRTNAEFAELRKNIVWSGLDDAPPEPRARMEKMMELIRAYQAVWGQVVGCPIASISLMPVRLVHQHSN